MALALAVGRPPGNVAGMPAKHRTRTVANSLGTPEAPWQLGVLSDTPTRVEDLADAWVFASFDADQALQRWLRCAVEDRADAYAAYRASLDREERAAQVLATALA
jgi:hypothetical protein